MCDLGHASENETLPNYPKSDTQNLTHKYPPKILARVQSAFLPPLPS